ncbi:uncharacterized protein LOC111079371 [Drosophila obscura]|uniref:uncharacterized protein LOC111079371 n=1 Tax=Drosophila obscura TaxID=7282 RepID=UPI000BA0CA98|nr:uncharacterized protein LOC111079371 [Drosophila obscura]
MKYILLLILIGLMALASALVHKVNLGKSADGKGCKTPKGDILPGNSVQDDKVCGIFSCSNDSGNGIIHYCQIPATFAECAGIGVSTTIDYPDCCWICHKDDCSKVAGTGDTKAPARAPTQKPPL